MTKKNKKLHVAFPKEEQGAWQIIDYTNCERCEEELLFILQDNKSEFSLGLTTILQGLWIAQKEGYVPEIPDDWWLKLRQFN